MFALGSTMGFPLAGRCAKMRISELRCGSSQFFQQGFENYQRRNEEKSSTRYKPCAKSEPMIQSNRRRKIPLSSSSVQPDRKISTQKSHIKPKNEIAEPNQMNHYTINIYFNANPNEQINPTASAFPRDISAMIPMDFSVDKLTKNIATGSPIIDGFLKNKDLERDKEIIEEKLKNFWRDVFENSKSEEQEETNEIEIKELEAKIKCGEEEKGDRLKNCFDYDKIKTYSDYLRVSEENENICVDKNLKVDEGKLDDEIELDRNFQMKVDNPEDRNVLKAPVPYYERGSYESRTVRPRRIISSADQVRRKLSKESEEMNKQVETLLKLSNQGVKENVFGRIFRMMKRVFYGEDEVKVEIDPEKLAQEKFLEKKRLQEEETKRIEEEKKVFQSYLRTFQEKYRDEENELKKSGFFNNLKEKFLNKNNFKESKREFSTKNYEFIEPKFFCDQKLRQNDTNSIKNKPFFKKYYQYLKSINKPQKKIVESEILKLEREKQVRIEQSKKLQLKIDFAKKNLKSEIESKLFISKILKQQRMNKNKFVFKPDEFFPKNFDATTEKEIKLKCDDLKRSKEIGENLENKEIMKLIEMRKNRNHKKPLGLIERKNNNHQTIMFFKRYLNDYKNNDCNKNDCPTNKKLTKRSSCGPTKPLKYSKLKCREEKNDDKDEKECDSLKTPEIDGLYDKSGDKLYESYFGVGGYRNKEYYSYKKTSFYDLMAAMSLGRVEQPKFPMKPR